MLRLIAILLGVAMMSSEVDAKSATYSQGWCDGYKAAAAVVWRNRNHHRAMSGYEPETQPEAMKRIYSKWPAPPPKRLPTAPKPSGTPVDGIVDVMLDSIDLYVVLPDPETMAMPSPPNSQCPK